MGGSLVVCSTSSRLSRNPASGIVRGVCYRITLLRGAIVKRTYGTHENLYISLFVLTIFGSSYYSSMVSRKSVIVPYEYSYHTIHMVYSYPKSLCMSRQRGIFFITPLVVQSQFGDKPV